MIADDAAVACMMNGEMSTNRMLIRQRLLVVRGHVQRDEQQPDHISHRPRASSGLFGRCVVAVGPGVLRRRQDTYRNYRYRNQRMCLPAATGVFVRP